MIWEEVKKTVSISRNFKLAGDVLVSILETELAFACLFPLIRLPLDRKPKFFFFSCLSCSSSLFYFLHKGTAPAEALCILLSFHIITVPPHVLTKINSQSDSWASSPMCHSSSVLLALPMNFLEELPAFKTEEEALSDNEVSPPFFTSDENVASFLFLNQMQL